MKNALIVALTLILLTVVLEALRAHERDALRRIVQEQCLPHFREHASSAPCERVVLPAAGDDHGFAILHDKKGGAHFLLIPTRTLTGIESAALLEPEAPDYVSAAWANRDVLEHWLGRALPRDAVGLAINPRAARGQDQFHIHLECVGSALAGALSAHAETIGNSWSALVVADRHLQVRRIMGDAFERANPIQLLARDLPNPRRDRGAYTLIVAGRTFAAGPGVVVLVGVGKPGGETLLDSRCAVATTG